MSYTVIARRYRSQTFDDVVGQDAIAHTLKNAIQMDRVAHAYLFCGTRGVGKTTMARILAKSLNCLEADGPTVAPCLKCDSCVSVNIGEDIDVIEIDGASNNRVENVRELISNAVYRPARARFKIYIIDEVHMLTASAFNALLKTLEEPPEHVKFIFATTEANKVLATIQSRCQRFDFQNINPEVIGAQLEKILKDEKIDYEKDLIIHLSRLAAGSMRDALSLLDQLISAAQQPLCEDQLTELLGIPDKQKVVNLLAAIADHDAAAVLNAAESLIDSGQSSVQICDLLIQNMRDMMVLQSAGVDSNVLLLTAEEKKQLSQLAQSFDVPALIYNITVLEKLRWTLRSSETSRALLEASLLRLALSEHFMALDRLSTQLGGSQSAPSAVKKKLTPGNPPYAAVPNTQQSVSVPAEIASIQSSWQKIAAQCSQTDASLGSFLSQGRPVKFENSTLLIQFNADGQGQLAQNMCQRKSDKIKTLLSGFLSTPVNIAIQSSEKGSPSSQKKESQTNTAASGINRQQRQQALNDPVVQMVLKGLNASPVEIQKVQIHTDDELSEDILLDKETE